VFEAGKLVTIEDWSPPDSNSGGALFPDLTFLQLVVGHRSLAELRASFADCGVKQDGARVLLEILFPKMPSRVWAIE
jgi:hypothetical protein